MKLIIISLNTWSKRVFIEKVMKLSLFYFILGQDCLQLRMDRFVLKPSINYEFVLNDNSIIRFLIYYFFLLKIYE